MITRRDMLSASLAAVGFSLVGAANASTLLAAVPNDSEGKLKPVALLVDETIAELGLGPKAQGVIPAEALSNLRRGVTWLNLNKGQCVICVVAAHHCFMVDEILKEARARVLFKGEHHSMALDQGPVLHNTFELPASAGIKAVLPEAGEWTDQLFTSLAQVANRQWSGHKAIHTFSPSNTIRPATAQLSLATYVIEI